MAVADSELWVAMLAEALKTYPSTGSLNTEISDLDEVRPIFTDLVTDLRKLVRKQAEHVMLPMECHYLNKSALVSVVSIMYNFSYLLITRFSTEDDLHNFFTNGAICYFYCQHTAVNC